MTAQKNIADSFVFAAESYVSDVISGKILACKWVKLACKRHVRDIEASESESYPYTFDAAKAERACKFVSLMPHVKGDWCFFDRKTCKWNPIKVEPWQAFIIASVFGWVRKSDGKRRFRKARVFVPRKNAKTALMAAIGLFMLIYDNEPGAEIYCGATSKKQAMEVFQTSRQMLLKSPRLIATKKILVNVQSIVMPDGSKFEPVIGQPKDGSSPHCAITDEYHEHRNSDLLDSVETGMGARSQPVSFVISTAGANTASPCRQEWKHCERILANTGGFEDDSYFAIIYTIDDGDSWDDLTSAIKANPNYAVSVYDEYLKGELASAKQTPRDQARYKTKHLDQWVTSKLGYFNVASWENLAVKGSKPEDFKEYPCILGCDFAHRRDLSSVMQLFTLPDNKYALFGNHFLPAYAINLPENQHYRNWKIEGWLTEAGENETDFASITAHIIDLCEKFQVAEVTIDPTRMWGMLPQLEQEGLTVVEYRQHVLHMSSPMKELDAAICGGRITHNGDPVTTWAISNIVTRQDDPKGNVFPRKNADEDKIDPVVAAIFAIGRAMTREDNIGALFAW